MIETVNAMDEKYEELLPYWKSGLVCSWNEKMK